MKPRRNPSWRVVTQRFARAIAALPSPPPGGTTWSSSSSSSVADQRCERRDVGVDPAGPIHDAGSLDDAGQLVLERLRQARHDRWPSPPRSRLRSPGAPPPSALPGADRSRSVAIRSARDQSTRPRRATVSARRPRTVAAAPSAEPTMKPACQSRSSRQAALLRPVVRSPRRSLTTPPPRARRARRRGTHRRTAGPRRTGRPRRRRSSAGRGPARPRVRPEHRGR